MPIQNTALQVAATSVRETLEKEGLRPTKESVTADDSILLQFHGEREALVELYPDGGMVVMVRSKDADRYYELLWGDLNRMLELLLPLDSLGDVANAEQYDENNQKHQEPVHGISEWQNYNDSSGIESINHESNR